MFGWLKRKPNFSRNSVFGRILWIRLYPTCTFGFCHHAFVLIPWFIFLALVLVLWMLSLPEMVKIVIYVGILATSSWYLRDHSKSCHGQKIECLYFHVGKSSYEYKSRTSCFIPHIESINNLLQTHIIFKSFVLPFIIISGMLIIFII